jgi:hypothetical protein
VQISLDRVVALCGEDKIGRDELGSLVDKLEEGVLGIGAWFAKEDGSRRVVHILAVTSDGLSIGFHGKLLEISREAVHVLIETAIY